MKIAQVTLAVPDDIYKGIMSGALEITAGVVRDNKGIIRKHLPKAARAAKEGAQQAAKAGAWQLMKNIKVVAIGAGILAAIGGGVAYLIHRRKERKVEEKEAVIQKFQKALKAYLKAAQSGGLNKKVVDNLLQALDEVEKNKAGEAIMLSIPASQLSALINSIFDYTKRLAEANAFEGIKIKEPNRRSKKSVINLQNYLEIQKQILDEAA